MTIKDRKCAFTAQTDRIEQKNNNNKKVSGTSPGVRCQRGCAPHPSLRFHHFACPVSQHQQLLIHDLSEAAASTPVETVQTAAEPIRPRWREGHCTLGLCNRLGWCNGDGSGNTDRVGDRKVHGVGLCWWGVLLDLTGIV